MKIHVMMRKYKTLEGKFRQVGGSDERKCYLIEFSDAEHMEYTDTMLSLENNPDVMHAASIDGDCISYSCQGK
jgi:hypothetical protein